MARVFGKRSLDNLKDAHPALVALAYLALKMSARDFTVICGYRNEADQNAAYASGSSKVMFPGSAHNQIPSVAIDVIPYPFKGWDDKDGFTAISDAFFKAARMLDIEIRWGGDWSRTGTTNGWDKPHFELHPWRNWKG